MQQNICNMYNPTVKHKKEISDAGEKFKQE